MALQVNLYWHLFYRALCCSSEKDGTSLFFFRKVEFLHSVLSKQCFFCPLLMSPKTSWREIQYRILLAFSVKKCIHAFSWGKIKTQKCWLFPVNRSIEQVKKLVNFHIRCDVNLCLYLQNFNQIWSGFYSSSWFCKFCCKFQRGYIANIFSGFAWANRLRYHNV